MTERNEDSYPWRQGYRAYYAKVPLQFNPYDQDTQPRCHQRWLDGWYYAEDENGAVG